MFMNLPLLSLGTLDIFGIDATTIIYLVLHVNFSKIHMDSEVVISMTLLFGRMLSLVNKFH